jgi:nucleotide-binding universal stress UspA family protein
VCAPSAFVFVSVTLSTFCLAIIAGVAVSVIQADNLAIIEEMRQGNYDLVVIGRRGASATIPTLVGGVAEKIAREAYGRTLWIVD